MITFDGNNYEVIGDLNTDLDTKNTAGSSNTSSKIFLIGATSQAANPITYSNSKCYIGTDGCLYSNGSKVITTSEGAVKVAEGSVSASAGPYQTSTSINVGFPIKLLFIWIIDTDRTTAEVIGNATQNVWGNFSMAVDGSNVPVYIRNVSSGSIIRTATFTTTDTGGTLTFAGSGSGTTGSGTVMYIAIG